LLDFIGCLRDSVLHVIKMSATHIVLQSLPPALSGLNLFISLSASLNRWPQFIVVKHFEIEDQALQETNTLVELGTLRDR
jgi:hypothetical protein